MCVCIFCYVTVFVVKTVKGEEKFRENGDKIRARCLLEATSLLIFKYLKNLHVELINLIIL